ncbi:hypothetical protein MLP_20610 [Microlunatus phosphovorus NM-1]|uniref:Uncharacterized protein n=1 Tax=Microlunatus phosphovorus (strain ATCC 700054 / DSM 10555 / JCM 9379 / NBRC 101784 / NCIMB 13414 / VKM Ac-1990 / NM-1) TaxID=1032480 RepID=F5XDQ2_MICPN|nr:hypothetical protein [Microlunatus phosphovorus]BAK35075.1 hypothetical protein MLP_20610 [Microlunatus phosphovorus NM-1]
MIAVAQAQQQLSTRQLWVLLAVRGDRVNRDPSYGGVCTVEGQSVCWTVMMLVLRGLIAFNPLMSSHPYLTHRGQAVLGSLT